MALLLRWLFGITVDHDIRKAIFSYPQKSPQQIFSLVLNNLLV